MKRSVTLFVPAFAAALAACSFLDKQDPTSTMSADKLYAEAKDALDGGQYDLAIKRYETLEARFPYGRYSQQGQLEIAYAYYKQADQTSAVAAAERFIKLHPNHPNVDYAYYLKGLAYFNEDLGILGRISNQDRTERDPKSARESFDAFKDLAQRYPESKYTPDALARMKYLINALASHEVHVARWYVRRGAYVAAVNRAQYALKNYPEAPTQEEALLIMVRSYDALGMTDLRNDAERIVRKNFPNSEQAKSVLSQLGR
ncbi:MAG TPA: outer membrane protein assembly factor BamD [Burkholderiales bacterium]|nr:outer membrane protein assembly factor BamD [Burkholderiales bacterium]